MSEEHPVLMIETRGVEFKPNSHRLISRRCEAYYFLKYQGGSIKEPPNLHEKFTSTGRFVETSDDSNVDFNEAIFARYFSNAFGLPPGDVFARGPKVLLGAERAYGSAKPS